MSNSLFHRVYYAVKPLLPKRVRYALRGVLARRQQRRAVGSWPILPGSEKPPEHWAGWPDGKKFAVVLTHDVEGTHGVEQCRQLAELESELGFRSSFNFVPEGEYRLGSDLRNWLTTHGFEVGVHDHRHDGKLYSSRESFVQGAEVINQHLKEWNAEGFRAGFMFHNLDWLHDLKVKYDASTFDTDPFEPQPSGVGTIFPFKVMPPNGGEGYVELPYTLVQDSTLFLFLREQSIRLWKLKLDWVAQHGGMVLLNIHPDYIKFGQGAPGWQKYSSGHYAELLKYVRDEYQGKYWHALPCELAKWFRSTPAAANGRPSKPDAEKQVSPETIPGLQGKRAASILFSDFPGDPRPRRAAEALHRAGMSVEVYCICEEGQASGWETVNGVRVFRVAIRRRRSGLLSYLMQYSRFLLGASWFLLRRSFRSRFNLIHVHNMPDFLAFSAILPKLFGAKVILDLHDPMPELYQSLHGLAPDHWAIRLLRRVERWSIGFADLALTPNISFRNLFVERSCGPGKVEVIMNSPDEEIFHGPVKPAELNLGKPQGGGRPFQILFHGSLVHRHGLDIAVEALIEARREILNARLVICGARTPYVNEVLEMAKEKGVEDCVFYLGMKTEAEIASIIAASDLGVIPNRRSPFTEINMPTRIFEFLAMGKPVIAPSTRGIRDYFSDENLLFFEPGNVQDLAAKFVRVYQCPEEISRIVQRGREIYERNMWPSNRRRFLDLVASLLNGSFRGSAVKS